MQRLAVLETEEKRKNELVSVLRRELAAYKKNSRHKDFRCFNPFNVTLFLSVVIIYYAALLCCAAMCHWRSIWHLVRVTYRRSPERPNTFITRFTD